MADKTINDLTTATSLNDGDLFEIENTGNNSRKVAFSVIRNEFQTELDFAPPTTSTHATERKTAANFTASSADDDKGLLFSLNPTGTGDKFIGRFKSPPSAPFTLTCRVRHTPHNTTSEVGLILHNTSNNRNLRMACVATRQVFSQSWSNLETFGATIGTGPTGSVSNLHIWLRISVDGSGNVAFYWSNDGAYWKTCGTTTLATYLTASGGSLDEVGVYTRANGNGGLSGATFHYYDES